MTAGPATSTETSAEYVLTIDCPDGPGIVYAVTGFLFEHGSNVVESHQFSDLDSQRFFMRVQFDTVIGDDTHESLSAAFAPVAERFGMRWELWDLAARHRTLIMVSKEGHCLNDLLYRWSIGSLQIDIPAIVGNHTDLEPLASSYGIPFHHLPVTRETKADAEAKLLGLVDELRIDLVVLARYMQILSPELCARLEGRVINIHHSFLPSFKGAKPYHQAYTHGVKLVGATAHYVTADLDEGPIIEQDVTRVDHTATSERLVAAGRDVESQVLSRAVRWHAESRIMRNGNKTVVFR
ncbi:MAG TPA: formyltetrahydrofolate deformylase [Nocardioidaceae bacterium]|nr:formyltetrahydrofolate deformylase [Nocardioidaceae bacterium]